MNFNLVALTICFLVVAAQSTIVLDGNGYSNIIVAIADDVPDGGEAMIDSIQSLLTETSAFLFGATNNNVYLKDITIIIPSSWKPISGVSTINTDLQNTFKASDLRLIKTDSAIGPIPYTYHSGKCGVAGNFIAIPSDYLTNSNEELSVQAKAMVQQWAQFRYGVFEEHGFPGDDLLPYFYRHPDGYDAVTCSNTTAILGDLQSTTGEPCEIDEQGNILNKTECRFIPSDEGQTSPSLLMSFYWLDSVTGFSTNKDYDRRPPHRQNRLCGAKSSSEIIFASPDFIDVTPNPGQDTKPNFNVVQNVMLPMVYIAIDTSYPTNSSNTGTPLGQLKRSLGNFFNSLNTNSPETYVTLAYFENEDVDGQKYLKLQKGPVKIRDGKTELSDLVNSLTYSTQVYTRDVSAVIREAEQELLQFKDVGGSILYIITSTESVTKDTIIETDVAEKFLLNNIKLMVAESGPDNQQALYRFSVLSQGVYYFMGSWTTSFFTEISKIIIHLSKNGMTTNRRLMISKKDFINTSESWTGTFLIDDNVGSGTSVVLRSPPGGTFTITLTSPDGQPFALENGPEVRNWNDPDSTIRVEWKLIPDNANAGRWGYTVYYDTSSCPDDCDPNPEIHLQIGSSNRTEEIVLPQFHSWVSLTPGSELVDATKNPAIIQARFDSVNGRIGGLIVTADVVDSNGNVIKSVPLSDTGRQDSDISKDGIYSGIFYPKSDGKHTVNIHAISEKSVVTRSDRLLTSNQDSFCCGSSLKTTTSSNFQSLVNEALVFSVQKAGSTIPEENLPIISDVTSQTYGVDGGKVIIALQWTVPINTASQLVKYSEDYTILLDRIETASQATVEYGSLENIEDGAFISVYVSAPYNKGKSVYFAVETSTFDNIKTSSHLTWTEPNPPEYPFTSPEPTTVTESTSTTTTQSTTTTEVTTTTGSNGPDPSTETTVSSTVDITSDVTTTNTDTSTTEISTETSSTSTETSTDITSSSTISSSTGSSASTESTTTISSSTENAVSTSTTEISIPTEPTDPTTDPNISTDSTENPDTTATSEITSDISTDSTDNPETTATTDVDIETTTEEGGGDGGDDNEGLTSTEIGYIVGGVVGGLVVIGAVTGGIIYYKRKQRASSLGRNANSGGMTGQAPRSAPANSPYDRMPPYTAAPTKRDVTNGTQQDYSSAPKSSKSASNPLDKPFTNAPNNGYQSYDNFGVTIEEDDITLTAM